MSDGYKLWLCYLLYTIPDSPWCFNFPPRSCGVCTWLYPRFCKVLCLVWCCDRWCLLWTSCGGFVHDFPSICLGCGLSSEMIRAFGQIDPISSQIIFRLCQQCRTLDLSAQTQLFRASFMSPPPFHSPAGVLIRTLSPLRSSSYCIPQAHVSCCLLVVS